MPEQTLEEQLTDLLKDTVDAEVQWGSPVVYVAQAVQEILQRWDLTPKVHDRPNEELIPLLADDASTFPDGHPCRDCDKLYHEHLSGDEDCEGWR